MDDMTNDERMGIELDLFKSAKPIRTALTLGPTIVLNQSTYEAALEHMQSLEEQVERLENNLMEHA